MDFAANQKLAKALVVQKVIIVISFLKIYGGSKMSQLDKEIWELRWEELNKRLKNMDGSFNMLDDRLQSIFNGVVKDLRGFAQSHFYFFYNGFFEKTNYRFEKRKALPPDYVLSTILGQISFDIDMIEKAARQRLSQDANFLTETDLLAQQALSPAIVEDVNLVDKGTKIITYFHKNYSIRIIPYTTVAFISIPYTCQGVDHDLLAIPHEIAHYVYRNGYFASNGESNKIDHFLNKQLERSPQFIKNWAEEIFADIYGCLIAGPVIALDFQDLQLATTFEEFKKDWKDKEDPVPLLRPDVYLKVLREVSRDLDDPLKTQWEDTTRILYDLWKERRFKKLTLNEPYPPLKDIDFTISNKTIELDEIMSVNPTIFNDSKELDRVILIILEKILKDIFLMTRNSVSVTNSLWSGDLSEVVKNNDHEILYSNFTKAKKELQQAGQKSRDLNLKLYTPVFIPNESKPKEVLVQWTKWAKDNKLIDSDKDLGGEILKRQWVNIFMASGWLTKGPVDNPVGG